MNNILLLIKAEWRMYASVIHAIIGSDNGISPVRRQSIIWTNDCLLLIGTLETNFSEIRFKTPGSKHATFFLWPLLSKHSVLKKRQ